MANFQKAGINANVYIPTWTYKFPLTLFCLQKEETKKAQTKEIRRVNERG